MMFVYASKNPRHAERIAGIALEHFFDGVLQHFLLTELFQAKCQPFAGFQKRLIRGDSIRQRPATPAWSKAFTPI